MWFISARQTLKKPLNFCIHTQRLSRLDTHSAPAASRTNNARLHLRYWARLSRFIYRFATIPQSCVEWFYDCDNSSFFYLCRLKSYSLWGRLSRLSWLLISFWAQVQYLHIVSYRTAKLRVIHKLRYTISRKMLNVLNQIILTANKTISRKSDLWNTHAQAISPK